MKGTESLHKKVQELIDCHAAADPLREMSALPGDEDTDEAALKWLALIALHGVTANASKIRIKRSAEGEVTVTAKYRDGQLPSPGAEIGEKIVSAVREISHIEGRKGKTTLALGLREGSIELKVKVKSDKGLDKVTFKFPE